MTPRAEYERRLARWGAAIADAERAYLRISNLRLGVGVLAAATVWLSVARGVSAAWLWGPAVMFVALIAVHARLLNRLGRARRAREFYTRGMARLDDRWSGEGRDGAVWLDGHPFARDLDLFGPGSLFQLLNTARTEAGETALAEWLRTGADDEEVVARQSAVDELRALVDFREDLTVVAADANVGRTTALARWAQAPAAGLTDVAAFSFAACAAVTIVVVALAFAGLVGTSIPRVWLVVQTLYAFAWRNRVRHALGRIDMPERDLALLTDLLKRIERQRFSSPRLVALRASLFTGGVAPSRRIAELRRLVAIVDSTRNLLFAPIASLVLLRSQAAAAIERWHVAYGEAVIRWLSVAGDVEALAALATYAYEHPDDTFPDLASQEAVFDAASLGHPLIAAAACVLNDVRLGGSSPHLLVVSGSNMSGKSTLLRAIGVNVVLAQAGAPVRAASLRLSRLVLGATIRVEDSLQEGRSRFYSEILRIRGIVDAARGTLPVLFLLDEILHGTNSHDRRIGAEAIARTLVNAGAIGLMTTHDLALTDLAKALPVAANVHFEDRIEDGRMVFDYRMKAGVVEHSNALELMRAVGLDV